MWDLPIDVEIDGTAYPIRSNCDYRVVLDVIGVLNDSELPEREKAYCSLYIFYGEAIFSCSDLEAALKEMLVIVNNGEEYDASGAVKPPLMDWHHDFRQLAPPISRILGYDVRLPDKYTHWYSFVGGYMEIGECTFQSIVAIRSKTARNKKLDKWEESFLRENRKMVELPLKLTAEEQAFLDSEW